MKKILYFFVVLVLLTGCAKGQNKEELNKLRDSLDNMVLRGSLRNDTTDNARKSIETFRLLT